MNANKVQAFHNWLLKINNIYLSDDEALARAFQRIENNE